MCIGGWQGGFSTLPDRRFLLIDLAGQPCSGYSPMPYPPVVGKSLFATAH